MCEGVEAWPVCVLYVYSVLFITEAAGRSMMTVAD